MSGSETDPRDEGGSPPPPPPNPPSPYGAGQSAAGYGPAQPGQWQQPEPWQQPGPPPPAHRTTGGVGQPADLGPRFVARLVDFILLGVVTGVIGTLLVVGALMGSDVGALSAWGVDRASSYAANAVSSVISAVISLGYFTVMETSRGQTVGKMLMKLETRGPAGGRPTVEQALKRNLFTAISILGIIPFLGFVSGLLSLVAVVTIAATISSNTTDRRGWHDNFAGGTTVVRTG